MKVILGPPGCGKTHRLVQEIRQELSRGTAPEQIGFASFTRKAVEEAIGRICAEFSLSPRRFPFVRTLHSMCFMALGLQRADVMAKEDWKRFGEELGFDMVGTSKAAADDGITLPTETKEGDRYLMALERSRLRCVSLEQELNDTRADDIHLPLLKKMEDLRGEYLRQLGKFTFTEMLEQFLAHGEFPHLKLLIIDEAQDLTPLQWKVVFKMANTCDRVIAAGDDDQAIHRWAGVDPRQFSGLAKQAEVLGQSYRLPKAVFDLSQRLVQRVPGRVEKPFEPAVDRRGSINWHDSADSVPLHEGSWTFMARTNARVARWSEDMRQQGLFYSVAGRPSVRKRTARAIRLWKALQQGTAISLSDVKALYAELPKTGGAAAVASNHEALLLAADPNQMFSHRLLSEQFGLLAPIDTLSMVALNLSEEDKRYISALLRRGEQLEQAPRIKLSTIHAMKGGEDDNILLDLGTTKRIEEGDHPEDEHRVFYVGVTRTKHNLHFLQPGGKYNYGI